VADLWASEVRTTPVHPSRIRGLAALIGTALLIAQSPGPAGAGGAGLLAPSWGAYSWPVRGPVLRGFSEPPTPYGSGHRGIDIGAAFGTDLRAADEGVVAFAGWVAGSLFISIDHPDGVRTTYSWLSAITVHKGEVVTRSQAIGATGHGHPEVSTPHLHFGARVGATYIDPMLLLERGSVVGLIHLAPLEGWSPQGARAPWSSPPGRGIVLPYNGRTCQLRPLPPQAPRRSAIPFTRVGLPPGCEEREAPPGAFGPGSRSPPPRSP
jgi:peptidase M23-like protein